jgi:hypothetical protein
VADRPLSDEELRIVRQMIADHVYGRRLRGDGRTLLAAAVAIIVVLLQLGTLLVTAGLFR